MKDSSAEKVRAIKNFASLFFFDESRGARKCCRNLDSPKVQDRAHPQAVQACYNKVTIMFGTLLLSNSNLNC